MDTQKVESRLKKVTTIDSITNCWLYNGYLTEKGYGIISVSNIRYRVHRISASIYLGYNLTDEVFQILHQPWCPNKNCWNPDHLYVGTTQDNSNDLSTVKLMETSCKHGHEYTLENTYIDKKNTRRCKTCNNERAKLHYAQSTGR